MEFHNLFPTTVATGRVEGADALNRRLVAEIERIRAATGNGKPESWACEVYTTLMTVRNLHELPGFEGLRAAILKAADDFAQYLEVDRTRVAPWITECWFNIYGRGHSQEVHNHAGHELSGVYYVKTPPGSGRISFYTPLYEDNFSPIPAQRPSWKSQALAHLQPREGDIVMFRSWLRHSVAPQETDEERISIAFNLVFRPPERPPALIPGDRQLAREQTGEHREPSR